MTEVYKGHEFESLANLLGQQVENLRYMTQLDLRVFSGYLTLQLVLGGWLVRHIGKGIGVGEFYNLLGDGIGHLLTAQADIGAPHATNGVEILLTIDIFDISTCALTDDQ